MTNKKVVGYDVETLHPNKRGIFNVGRAVPKTLSGCDWCDYWSLAFIIERKVTELAKQLGMATHQVILRQPAWVFCELAPQPAPDVHWLYRYGDVPLKCENMKTLKTWSVSSKVTTPVPYAWPGKGQ